MISAELEKLSTTESEFWIDFLATRRRFSKKKNRAVSLILRRRTTRHTQLVEGGPAAPTRHSIRRPRRALAVRSRTTTSGPGPARLVFCAASTWSGLRLMFPRMQQRRLPSLINCPPRCAAVRLSPSPSHAAALRSTARRAPVSPFRRLIINSSSSSAP
jgi:hypothetical protein